MLEMQGMYLDFKTKMVNLITRRKAVKLGELLGKKNIVVRFKNTTLKSNYGNVNVSAPITGIQSVQKYGSSTTEVKVSLVFQGDVELGRAPYNYVLSMNNEVQLIEGDEAKPILEEMEQSFLNNLRQYLNHTFTIGADPEIFVEKDGVVVPAFSFLGSKEKPTKFARRDGSSGNLYWDGFQAEFDTLPMTCLAYHGDEVQCALKHLHSILPKGAILSSKTTVDVPQDMMISAKDEHVAFGCMPSRNVYNMKGIEAAGRDVFFRSAGGHIHFGIGKQDPAVIDRIVKALDAILGVCCVSLFAKMDDPRRRTMYGLAGEYRLPTHGLEYRVLSNAWLCHPVAKNLVFDLARKVLRFGQEDLMTYWKADEKETIECINNCDVEKAHEIMKRNKYLLVQLFKAAYMCDNANAVLSFKVFMKGIDSIVKDTTDIAGNWGITSKAKWVDHLGLPNKSWQNARQNVAIGKKIC